MLKQRYKASVGYILNVSLGYVILHDNTQCVKYSNAIGQSPPRIVVVANHAISS